MVYKKKSTKTCSLVFPSLFPHPFGSLNISLSSPALFTPFNSFPHLIAFLSPTLSSPSFAESSEMHEGL